MNIEQPIHFMEKNPKSIKDGIFATLPLGNNYISHIQR